MNSINSNIEFAKNNDHFLPDIDLDEVDQRVSSMKRRLSVDLQVASPQKQYFGTELPVEMVDTPLIDLDNMFFPNGFLDYGNDFLALPQTQNTKSKSQYPRKSKVNPEVLEAIKSIIESEDKALPYTDKQISEKMEILYGFPIINRTVTNLRFRLGIPESRARQILIHDPATDNEVRKTRNYKTKSSPVLDFIKQLIESEDKRNPYPDTEILEKINTTCGVTICLNTVCNLRNRLKIPDYRNRKLLPALEGVKNIIDSEDKRNPYTDKDIVERLKNLYGITLTAKKVSYLRNKSNIAASFERKKLS